MNYEIIRKLIANNKIIRAFDLILEDVDSPSYQTAFIQLKGEFLNWRKEDYKNLGPERFYRERIRHATLVLLSEYEEINSGLSNRKKLLFKCEQELSQKLEYLLTLDKKHRIDKVIEAVKKCSAPLFNSIQNKSNYYHQLNGIDKENSAQQAKAEEALKAIEQDFQTYFAILQNDFPDQSTQLDFFKTKLLTDPSYLAKWLVEQQHKKAKIDLLWQEIEALKNKYQQIKTASVFGLIGFLISNQIQSKDESTFDERYDEPVVPPDIIEPIDVDVDF